MILLIFGVFLWSAAHYFNRLAPDMHAGMGKGGRMLMAVLIVVSVLAMIFGYRAAPFILVWSPPSLMVHINNLLMIIAFFIYGMSATTGRLRGKLRHPQLTAVKIWATAHLLVNGDLASVILFGGMFAWAIGSVILINRAEPNWQRPAPGAAKKDIILVVVTLVMISVVASIHIWAGVWPFPR